jgi:hypothetical protein
MTNFRRFSPACKKIPKNPENALGIIEKVIARWARRDTGGSRAKDERGKT